MPTSSAVRFRGEFVAKRVGFIALVAVIIAPLVVVFDARHRRSVRIAHDLERLVSRLPSGDLAVSGSMSAIRHVSLEDPWSAFADGPAMRDVDPAAGLVAPGLVPNGGSK